MKEEELYREFIKRHLERFKISEKEFERRQPKVQYPVIAKAVNHQHSEPSRIHPFEPYLTFKVDLRFSGNKIIKEVEKLVRYYKKKYDQDFERTMRDNGCDVVETVLEDGTVVDTKEPFKKALKWMCDWRLDERYVKASPRDLETYHQQLKVYDLKRDRVKETQIAERLNILPHTVKNHWRAANKYIEKGPPFGPPFK